MDLKAKYPTLYPQFEKLQAERAVLLAKLEPLEKRADELRAKADEAERAWREVREEIVAIERSARLAQISNELAALARAMGAHRLAAEGGKVEAKGSAAA